MFSKILDIKSGEEEGMIRLSHRKTAAEDMTKEDCPVIERDFIIIPHLQACC
jgi:hypothetical protein